jgi:hypothetical protein
MIYPINYLGAIMRAIAFCNVINYEMQGLELVTPLQEVFAGAGEI